MEEFPEEKKEVLLCGCIKNHQLHENTKVA